MKISKSFKTYIHIILVFLISKNLLAADEFSKNIVIHEKPQIIKELKFKDFNLNSVDFTGKKGNIMILNFWATWCAPCKKEMPSLDRLYQNNKFKNLKVFAINLEAPNILRTKKFFNNLNIKKLEIFFDKDFNSVKEFKLRGVPTTILINKKGEAFATIIGEINFQNKKFTKWLLKYD